MGKRSRVRTPSKYNPGIGEAPATRPWISASSSLYSCTRVQNLKADRSSSTAVLEGLWKASERDKREGEERAEAEREREERAEKEREGDHLTTAKEQEERASILDPRAVGYQVRFTADNESSRPCTISSAVC